jgi:hypothetical protein
MTIRGAVPMLRRRSHRFCHRGRSSTWRPVGPSPGDLLADIERIKRLLWHNNLYRAVPAMDDLQDDAECWRWTIRFAASSPGRHANLQSISKATRQPHQLWRAVPRRRAYLFMPGRIHGEYCRQQALCQASTVAMDVARRTPVSASPNPRPQRHAAAALRAMISWLG